MLRFFASLAAAAALCSSAQADWWFHQAANMDLGPTYRFPLGYYAGADFYYDYAGYDLEAPWWVTHHPADVQRFWNAVPTYSLNLDGSAKSKAPKNDASSSRASAPALTPPDLAPPMEPQPKPGMSNGTMIPKATPKPTPTAPK